MAIPFEIPGKSLNRQLLSYVNVMVNLGVLTDSVVGALTTVAGLRAVAFSGTAAFEVDRRFYEQFQKSLDRGSAAGIITDAAVAAAGNVAGLRGIFTGNDSTLVASQVYSTVA